MAASGLIEVASHTHDLHRGILANPQGNSEPAAAARAYDSKNGRYESDQAYRARLADDASVISDEIEAAIGKRPRIWVRSEEHTSELQSLMRISYAVFCLKKKTEKHTTKKI